MTHSTRCPRCGQAKEPEWPICDDCVDVLREQREAGLRQNELDNAADDAARGLNEHDARILGPKSKARHDPLALAEFAATHAYCQACGADYRPLQIHHILGGRAGRSDEACNLLRLCSHPCHLLAEGLDVTDDSDDGLLRHEGRVIGLVAFPRLLPKLTLAIQLTLKIKAGELVAPYWTKSPCPEHTGRFQLECVACNAKNATAHIDPRWERLAHLNGAALPALAAIPEFFLNLYRLNRPELRT
jgi:hypothetical protein